MYAKWLKKNKGPDGNNDDDDDDEIKDRKNKKFFGSGNKIVNLIENNDFLIKIEYFQKRNTLEVTSLKQQESQV